MSLEMCFFLKYKISFFKNFNGKFEFLATWKGARIVTLDTLFNEKIFRKNKISKILWTQASSFFVKGTQILHGLIK